MKSRYTETDVRCVMKKAYKYISLVIILITMVAISMVAVPFLRSFNEPQEFRNFIENFGVFGILVMLFIQIGQIIVAFIPGELVEFLAGCMYGTIGGLAVCLVGVSVGQAIIFQMVRKFGHEFVEAAAGSKAMGRFKFLKDEKKLMRVIFLLFFLPGTPKAIISYAVPFTSIRLKSFLLLTAVARIPSIVSSTYAGSAFVKNNYKPLLIAYGIILAVSLIGFILYRLYEKKLNKRCP